MSGSVNRVILIGNLGRDPEARTTQNGSKLVNMTVATSETWKDRQSGERKEKTEWHRVCIFDERIADVAEKYLKKGSKVYLEGTLQTRKWTGNDGIEKYTTEVIVPRFNGVLTMLDSPRDNSAPDWDSGGSSDNDASVGDTTGAALDDSIPFAPEWR